MQSEELEQWLLALPLDEPCDIDGEAVYLRVRDGGAELGLILVEEPTDNQIADTMRSAFQCALDFDAGLAIDPEGGELILNRWLPGAEAWSDVAEALEGILNQAALWRAAMTTGSGRVSTASRAEERARQALNGGLR